MNYLTTVELSKKWNVSSRMIAYYCKSGRINGAIKKGKTWLIPANASKPIDHRMVSGNVPVEDVRLHVNDGDIDRFDIETSHQEYLISDLNQFIGITRETIRYYEEIGLITARRNEESNYRIFNGFDIFHLMTIEFYKKRGFSNTEIKDLLEIDDAQQLLNPMAKKRQELEYIIKEYQSILHKLDATQTFITELDQTMNQFSLKLLPSFTIQETFSSFSAFNEYQEKLINTVVTPENDLLSSMMRIVYFDETGFTESQMSIVDNLNEHPVQQTEAIHIRVSADNNDDTLMKTMYVECEQWAKQHHLKLQGSIYIFLKLVLFNHGTEHSFYDVFVPIKQ